ncbi:hypothetical protein CRG98_012838 [Punica granatum]|uniref:Uncharacterized protein n=1 Tax=Punica granatum TaxID=22663 RepID=A0A2I0KE95_PUNGR|nr:hypothetical protein CRG98_012838 [Punica granatum]
MKELGQLAGNPNPTIEVADAHRECQKPRGWDQILINSRARAANLQPRPTSMVTGILCGCMRPRW